MASQLPILCVEGKDDISVINALLLRHGVDTNRGSQHLQIRDLDSAERVLDAMPDAIRASTDRPVGFVIDIDIQIADRWNAVKSKLSEAGIAPPASCPPTGFFGQLPTYPHRFGVWLMPDCATDNLKLEHLCRLLMQHDDPLWPHAQSSVNEAARLIDIANAAIAAEEHRWRRFRDVDRIKAEVHSWLAWQRVPGAPFGAAVNDRILGRDSPQALAFLRWLRDLYGFGQLTGIDS